MKFIKGMVVGTMVATGVAMMWMDNGKNSKNLMKKGRKIARRMGMM